MGNYSYNTPSGMTLSQFYDLVDGLAQGASITLDSSTFSESGGQFHFVQVPDLTTPQQNAIQDLLNEWVYVDYEAISNNAINQAAAIPGWATWDESQAQTWHDDNIKNPVDQLKIDVLNITNLASALPVLVAMVDVLDKLGVEGWAEARMLLALRNKNFPNLEGSNGS